MGTIERRRPFGLPGWGYWIIALAVAGVVGNIPFVGLLLTAAVLVAAIIVWVRAPKVEVAAPASRVSVPATALSSQWGEIEVQGESFRRDAIRRLFEQLGLPEGGVTHHVAELIPEPSNQYDTHAVKVVVSGWHIGYIPSEISQSVARAIGLVRGNGQAPVRVWADPRDGTWRARATLYPEGVEEERDFGLERAPKVIEVDAYRVAFGTSRSSRPSGYESPYIDSERSATLLVPGADGMPPLHFVSLEGEWWLAEDSTGLLVNVGNRQLRRLGVWTVKVRGEEYAPGFLRTGVVELVREPDNEHDPNAVAIHQGGARCGYWNKAMAKALGQLLDAGEELQAVAISADPPKVVAASPPVMEHLVRKLKRPS